MKTLKLGPYLLTVNQIGARYWFTISWGNTILKRSHERSEHRATMRALDKLETFVNI